MRKELLQLSRYNELIYENLRSEEHRMLALYHLGRSDELLWNLIDKLKEDENGQED